MAAARMPARFSSGALGFRIAAFRTPLRARPPIVLGINDIAS
jgi:hypothetical protein